jgi:hypothetical protein
MSLRRILSLLCLALCAAVLAGCGGDTLSFDPVASAASETVSSTSARADFTGTMTVAGAGSMSFNGSGVFDGRGRSGALNMNFRLPPAAQAQLGGTDPSIEMIMDGRDGIVIYMRSAMFNRFSGGKWVKLDIAALAKKEGVDMNGLMNAYQADPSENLRMLTASSDAHVVDYQRVRGVFTTHYTLNIDLKKLADKTHNKTYDSLRKLAGIESIPAEAWLDKQGRIRRMKIDMSFGGAYTMSLTEELYAFGIKVDAQPPAAGDVVDASTLVSQGG